MNSILLIDDDPTDLAFLESAIRQADNSAIICKAHGGREALSILYENLKDLEFNVIITDYSMPDITGLDVIAALAEDERFKNTKKIIFSSISAEIKSSPILQKNVADLMQKPDDYSGYKSVAAAILALA